MRRLGPALGLVLLIAALLMIWRQRAEVARALGAVSQMSPADRTLHLGVLVGTVLANIVCTATMFTLLMRRYGTVGLLEMQSLIAASTLLNYVPLRPGLFGRVAYHRLYNSIAVGDSIKAVLQAIILSFACVVMLGAAVGLSVKTGVWQWPAMLVPLAALVVAASAAAMSATTRRWSWPVLAAAIRYLDLLATAVRYYAAFALIGSPIGFEQAAAFACIAVVATMAPFLSNGLGLREWAIGLASPVLAAAQIELAITADLINRAVEIAVIVPAGLAGIVHLARLRTRRNLERPQSGG